MLRIIFLIAFFWILIKKSNGECSVCDQSKCSPPTTCLAGLVKDKCDCCFVCGALEGQRCYTKKIPGHENDHSCGSHMLCKVRDDLEKGDTPDAICYCQHNEKICGSDGITYNNICHFNEARYKKRNGLGQSGYGPCKYAPKLSTLPKSVQNKTGSSISFTCEGSGWPLPTIEWRFVAKDKENTEYVILPNDDPLVTVQTFGGSYETTSWIQISRIGYSHVGTYECTLMNSQGEVSAKGKLSITDLPKNAYRRIQRIDKQRKRD